MAIVDVLTVVVTAATMDVRIIVQDVETVAVESVAAVVTLILYVMFVFIVVVSVQDVVYFGIYSAFLLE